MDSNAPTSLLLKDLIDTPSKAEPILDLLSSDQIQMIENTINRIKKRKLDKEERDKAAEMTGLTTDALANALASAMTAATMQGVASATASTASTSSTSAATPSTTISATTATGVTAAVDLPSSKQEGAATTNQEPVAEVRDGVEWVSFVYSHNRTLKRYTIRTDIHTVVLDLVDEKFKEDNCVYPRANLPREKYQGNRWAYETECNVLGWKLAWLNKDSISGKRGLIQRAVDSYRNRYPSMRSRRVARQEKLMKGTLRKRKNRDTDEKTDLDATATKSTSCPKTITVDDLATGTHLRIKIHVESVNLDVIPVDFRKANCVYPRAMAAQPPQATQTRLLEENMCNELGWKLAWLNQRHLAGKKNLLQRVLDVYRAKFVPVLQPRKNSSRCSAIPTHPIPTMPLTASALSAQNEWFAQQFNEPSGSPCMSCTSGTTASLDFGDCLSLADEPLSSTAPMDGNALSISIPSPSTSPPYSPTTCGLSSGCDESVSTSTSSSCTPSPPATSHFFGLPDCDLFDSFMLPPANDTFLTFDHAEQPSDTKLYDPILSSPSLPSSAVQRQDLVKMEEDNLLLPSDLALPSDAEHLLMDSLF